MTVPEAGSAVFDGVVVRFRSPAAALGDVLTDYGIYDSGPAGSRLRSNLYPPGIANLCLLIEGGPMRVAIRNRHYAAAPEAMLFGPTSHAMRIDSNGGRLVGIGISPLGWARLFDLPASAAANRLLPLGELWGRTTAQAFHAAVAAAPNDDAIVATLDRLLLARLAPPHPDDALVRALCGLVLDPAVEETGVAAARLGVTVPHLRRLASAHLGFPPKLLMRRARFIRALVAVATHGDQADFATVAPRYYDRSHFIRDAQSFLGMTARQFATDMTPLMQAMIQGRKRTFGQPMQSLIAPHRPPATKHLDAAPPPA